MKNNATIISPEDNVVVAIEPIHAGDAVLWGPNQKTKVTAVEDIPIYHKIAIADIKPGEKVVKYGEHIGEATEFIPKGAHVHVHNVRGVRENLDQK